MSTTPIPDPLRWEVWSRDNFTCLCCGSRMFLVIDHVHPEAHGGKTVIDNLQTLCQPCNSRKNAHITQYVLPGEKCSGSECWCRKVERDYSKLNMNSGWKIPSVEVTLGEPEPEEESVGLSVEA